MRSDLYQTENIDLTETRAMLPVFVPPERDEALCSWLIRLAAKLDVPAFDLLRRAFGLTRADPHWWRRPADNDLHRIAERAGTESRHIRAMTLHDWTLARDDELSRRFQPGRNTQASDKGTMNGAVVLCPACLATDNTPYVRREWMVGWVGVCPVHQVVLEEHCQCGTRMRIPGMGRRSVEIGHCARCGASAIGITTQAAHPVALAVQKDMLAIKRAGSGKLRGVGNMTWPSTVALVDLIGAMLWKCTTDFAREDLFQIIADDLGLGRLATDWATNNGMLVVLGWLLARWEQRVPLMMEVLDSPPAAAHAGEVLGKDRMACDRLLGILPPVALELGYGPPVWRHWLRTLPPRSALIERARHARDSAGDRSTSAHMRRVLTLADLRNGVSIEKVAERHGYRVTTIERWLAAAQRHGIGILIEDLVRRDMLREDQWDRIASWIKMVKRDPSPHCWSPLHVQAEVRKRFGIMISHSVAREMLWGLKPRLRGAATTADMTFESAVKEPVHGLGS